MQSSLYVHGYKLVSAPVHTIIKIYKRAIPFWKPYNTYFNWLYIHFWPKIDIPLVAFFFFFCFFFNLDDSIIWIWNAQLPKSKWEQPTHTYTEGTIKKKIMYIRHFYAWDELLFWFNVTVTYKICGKHVFIHSPNSRLRGLFGNKRQRRE